MYKGLFIFFINILVGVFIEIIFLLGIISI